jgi:hypothetical protein
MTGPTARELVDLNALPSPNSRLDARAESFVPRELGGRRAGRVYHAP